MSFSSSDEAMVIEFNPPTLRLARFGRVPQGQARRLMNQSRCRHLEAITSLIVRSQFPMRATLEINFGPQSALLEWLAEHLQVALSCFSGPWMHGVWQAADRPHGAVFRLQRLWQMDESDPFAPVDGEAVLIAGLACRKFRLP